MLLQQDPVTKIEIVNGGATIFDVSVWVPAITAVVVVVASAIVQWRLQSRLLAAGDEDRAEMRSHDREQFLLLERRKLYAAFLGSIDESRQRLRVCAREFQTVRSPGSPMVARVVGKAQTDVRAALASTRRLSIEVELVASAEFAERMVEVTRGLFSVSEILLGPDETAAMAVASEIFDNRDGQFRRLGQLGVDLHGIARRELGPDADQPRPGKSGRG